MKKLALALALLLPSVAFATAPKIFWSAPAWNAATVYSTGQFIRPATSTFTFINVDGGTSGAAQPIWCTQPDNCLAIEDGGLVIWNAYPLEARTYTLNGSQVPMYATPSKAVGNSSLTFDAVLFSNAIIGATINLYGDGSGSVLSGGSLVTACTACLVTISNVVLPVTTNTLARHTVRATVTETGTVTGVADTSFNVDYRTTNSGLTIVFTFDDSFLEQYLLVAPTLEANGIRGTFYVNAPRITGNIQGSSFLGYGVDGGYMSAAMVQDLQRRGHEIGIHTLNHLNAPCLSPATQHMEYGNDGELLRSLGFQIFGTAYPFGTEQIPQTWTVDQDLGLTSARDIGNLNNARGYCGQSASNLTAPYAERIPPRIPYDITCEPSLAPTCVLSDLQNYVLDAEAHGGGLLVLNTHHVCPVSGGTCDATLYPSPTLAIDQTAWTQFIPWVAAHCASTGCTFARMVDVTSGSTSPHTTWPTLAIKNGGLEDYANLGSSCVGSGPTTVPDCFVETTTGSSNAVFTWAAVASPVHGGSWAYKLNITNSPTQGSVRIASTLQPNPEPPIPDQNCTPWIMTTGQQCTFSFWYQSSNTINLQLFAYTPPPPLGDGGPTGSWVNIKSLNGIAASPGVWAQASFQTTVSGTGSVPAFPGTYDGGGIPVSVVAQDATTGSVSNMIVDDFNVTCP